MIWQDLQEFVYLFYREILFTSVGFMIAFSMFLGVVTVVRAVNISGGKH